MAFTARTDTKFVIAPEHYELIFVRQFSLKAVKKHGKYLKKFRYALNH